MKRLLGRLGALLDAKFDSDSIEVETSCSGGMKSRLLTTTLNSIGDTWRCWRIPREPDREFAFRLGVHLQALAIAIEDDLERVLAAEREIVTEERER